VKICLFRMIYSRNIFIKPLESGQIAWVVLTRIAKRKRIDHFVAIGEDGMVAQVTTSLYVAAVVTQQIGGNAPVHNVSLLRTAVAHFVTCNLHCS